MKNSTVDLENLKNLEQYSVILIYRLAQLKELLLTEVKAQEVGILDEELESLSISLCENILRLVKLYERQISSVLNYLPDDLDHEQVIKSLQKKKPAQRKKKS